MLAIHGGHANLRTHGGLGYRDWHDAVQVVALAREKGMFLHVQHNIQISGGTTEGTHLARSGQANSRSIFDAGGNFDLDRALAQIAAFAFALGARIGDHVARALARRTSTRDAEESLLVANLTATVAGAASGWSLPWR